MKTNLSQQDLKQIISDAYKQPIKSISFNLETRMRGLNQRDMEEVPVFDNCTVTFDDNKHHVMYEDELKAYVSADFDKKGYTANSESDIKFNMSTRVTGSNPLSRKTIPVFRGCSVEYQEKKVDVTADKNEQQFTSLTDMRREEHYQSLMEMPERDMLEMIRAHFESHPTLPGEKELKDKVNNKIENLNNAARMGAAPKNGQYPPLVWIDGEKESLARQYADTRIRETPVNMAGVRPEDLNRKPVVEIPQAKTNSTVYVSRVDVELQKQRSGDVYVLAEKADGKHITIGSLQDKFLTNNPMNVDSCKAELQIADYSNGKMKNLSARVVVDTDLMSGDVIDLDDDMLAGLDQINGLEQ